MAPGGAAQHCCVSRVALKFLELVLVQRKVGNRLHRLFLLHLGAPGLGRRLQGRQLRPPDWSLLSAPHIGQGRRERGSAA